MKRRILITGGTGYIGSHTAIELIEAGFEPVIVDSLSNSEIEVLDRIETITSVRPAFELFDLCESRRVSDCFRKYPGIQAVIHFAAHKAVGDSVKFPLKYYHNNLLSLIYLLEAMVSHGVSSLLFSSSCTVYGQPDELPVTEQASIKSASSPYGNTKQIGEEIIRDTIDAGANLQSIALRYFNPIGAHPSGLIGELPRGIPGNLVPFLTQTAMGIRDELQIFGNDYGTPDRTAIRDYINVVDLARAHVAAIGRLLKRENKTGFEVFNIGTGKGTSVRQMVDSFERATGVKVKFRFVPRRDGDIEAVWADTTLANQELGWKAEKTLEETLISAWKWEQHIRSRELQPAP